MSASLRALLTITFFILTLPSSRSDACLEYIKNSQIKNCECTVRSSHLVCNNADLSHIQLKKSIQNSLKIIRLNGTNGLKDLDNTFLSSLSDFPYLEELSISNCTSYLTVNGDFLWRFPRLKHLSLTGSCLNRFINITKTHSHLESLILNDNKIVNLISATIHNLIKLQRLELNRNLLKNILPRWFPINSSLKYLSLESNFLHGLDANLDRHLNQLETLLLGNNLFSGTLRTAKSQTSKTPPHSGVNPLIKKNKIFPHHMNLSRNGLTRYKRGSDSQRAQQSLLNECPPENEVLPESWGLIPVLPNLTTLDLSNNCLSQLQSVLLMQFTHLTHLLLPNNRIKSILTGAFYIKPPSHVNRRNSEGYLNAESDRRYGPNLEDAFGLQLLDLSFNRGITEVFDNWTFGLKNTREIRLNDCNISGIEKGAFNVLLNVRVLHLQNNNLSTFTHNPFKFLKSLEELKLDHNNIDFIEKNTFQDLRKLKQLSLSGNLLSSFNVENTDRLSVLPSSRPEEDLAKDLNLIDRNGNQLAKNHFLRQFSLSRSRTSGGYNSAGGVFSHLSQLVSLDLSGNNISTLRPKDLDGLQSLVSLNLLDNPLKRLEQGVFCDLSRLEVLKMDSSQLICDCSLFKTLDCILIKKWKVTGKCNKPQRLLGHRLTSVQFSDLESGRECRSPPLTVILHTNAHNYQSSRGESRYLSVDMKWMRVGEPLTMSCDVIMSAANDFGRPLIKWERVIRNQRVVEIVPGQRRAVLLYPPRRVPYSDSRVKSANDTKTPPSRIQWRSSLQIQSITLDDTGAYRCSAETSHGVGLSKLTEISIYSKPSLTVTPDREIISLEGETVNIGCQAEGYPQPKTSLKLVSSQHLFAALTQRMMVSNDKHDFFITNIQLEDAGEYMCHSTNIAGNDSYKFTIKVNSSPKFTETPSSRQRIFEGQDLVLHVNMTGYPAPTIKWMKSNSFINVSQVRHNMKPGSARLTEGNRKLTLFKVRPEDATVYSIILTNPLGTAVYNVTIDVVNEDYVVFTGSPLDVTHSNPRSNEDPIFEWLSKHWVGVIVIAVVLCVVITSLLWVLALVCLGWKKHILPSGRHSGMNGLPTGANSSYRPVRQENGVDDISGKHSVPSLSALLSSPENSKFLHCDYLPGNYPANSKPLPALPSHPPPSNYTLGKSIDHLDSALSEWNEKSTFMPRSSSVANPDATKSGVSFTHFMHPEPRPPAPKLTKSHNSLASCSSLAATGNTPMFRRHYPKSNLYPGSSASSNPVSATSDYNTATSGGSCESGSSPIEDDALLSGDPPLLLSNRTNSLKHTINHHQLRHYSPSNKKTNFMMTSSLHQSSIPYDSNVNNSVTTTRGLPPLHRSHSAFSSNCSNNKKAKLHTNPLSSNGKPKFAHTPV